MPDGGGMDDVFIEIVLIGIGLICLQRPDLRLDASFRDFYQEIREKAITRTEDVKTQQSGAPEGTKSLIGDRFMILVNIPGGVNEDHFRVELFFQTNHHFQDLLPGGLKAAGGEIMQDGVFGFDPEDAHAGLVFLHQVVVGGILLIVGEGDTHHIGLVCDIRNQCAAAQLNIVRMRADETNSFSEKSHIMIHRCLLLSQETANHFGHHQLSVTFEPLLCNLGNFCHDLCKIFFGLKEGVPQQAVLGK